MRRCLTILELVLLVWAGAMEAAAEDWPQWRGPERNGISREKDWLAGWPDNKPARVAWRATVGQGHSAISVAGGRAYTLGWDGKQDTVYCQDAVTGERLWTQSYPCKTIVQWPGPRATPTVDGETVYTLGQWGQMFAWDAKAGRERWRLQLAESYNPDIDYGFAWSALVQGDHLILSCGSRGLGIDKRTGKIAWGDDGQKGACSSPVPFTYQGQAGVAVVVTDADRNAVRIVGVDPKTGAELFRSPPWQEKWGAACVDLIIDGGKIFITTAEQHRQAGRFSLDGKVLKEDWTHNRLAGYTGACVLLEGNLYGVDARGILQCLDWETGKVRWSQRGFDDRGSLSATGGQLLIQTGNRGEIVVATASPDGYREVRRQKIFEDSPQTFTTPVLANGRIYCRSYAGEVVCLDVTGR